MDDNSGFDDISCPGCKTTKSRNPSMKLLVNACGHSLCESCVDLLFVRGSAKCPTDSCGLILRRANFRVQLFDDAFVEKEIDVRKRILRDFNKKESDFETLREYNDYLEEVESIIFNLTNNIDVEETEERVKAYRRENQEYIRRNRTKLTADELLLEQLIAEERELQNANQKCLVEADELARRQKQKQRDQLIDDLMFSDLPANCIMEQHRAVAAPPLPTVLQLKGDGPPPVTRITTFSSGIPLAGRQETIVPLKAVETAELFKYTPLELNLLGPKPPTVMEIVSNNYLVNIRAATVQETAGGYQSYIACQRALQDAFCGIYFVPTDVSDSTVQAQR